MELSWFDAIIGVLILLLAIRGVINGFIREFFGLAGIVGGVYVASVYGGNVGLWISANVYAFKNPSAIALIGFLALLIVIWVGALLIAEVSQRLVKLSGLSVINRLLGFAFGGFKMFMIFAILLAALTQIHFAKTFIENRTQNSILYPLLKSTGDTILGLNATQEPTSDNLKHIQ